MCENPNNPTKEQTKRTAKKPAPGSELHQAPKQKLYLYTSNASSHKNYKSYRV